MKRFITLKGVATATATLVTLVSSQAWAATPLNFDFEGDSVGSLPTGWFDNYSSQSAQLVVVTDANNYFGQGTANNLAQYTESNSGDNGLAYVSFTPNDGSDYFTITFDYYMPTDAQSSGLPNAVIGNSDLNNSTRRHSGYGGPDDRDALVTVSILVNESGSSKTFFNPVTSTTDTLADGASKSFDFNHSTGIFAEDTNGSIALPYSDVDKFGFKTATSDIAQFLFDDVVLHDNSLTVFPEEAVVLSGYTVASNAPPGTRVGTLGMVLGNPQDFAFSLLEVDDFATFDIAAGTTNLRTAAWIAGGPFNISIVGTNANDGFTVTNDFTITATAGSPVFVVSAQVQSGAADGTVIGTAKASSAAAVFSVVAGRGRDDLFAFDGSSLKVANSAEWGEVGSTHYVTVRATTGAETDDLILAVDVVTTASPSGTVFSFR